MVPAKTEAPATFSTGMLSPVSMDSSTADSPSVTVPSTGMRSPGRTTTTSPGSTSSVFNSTSAEFRITRAVGGCSSIRRRMASPAWPRARASSMRPSRISATITAAASK